MNFTNFLVKHEKKRKKNRLLLDDRPFNSIIDADESKQRLLSHDRTGHWVNCARHRVDSDDDSDDDSKFKSFNHYFVDEPIYSEPDLREGISESGHVSEEPSYDHCDLVTMVTSPRGRGQCHVSSTDSDYESFSLDRADMETQQPGRSGQHGHGSLSTHFLELRRNKIIFWF